MSEIVHRYKVSNDTWYVSAVYIGEGQDGEYDENDPFDYPRMRYDFCRHGEDEDEDSYCTAIDARNKKAVKGMAAIFLDCLDDVAFPKHQIQWLAWITNEEAENYYERNVRET